MKRNYRKLFAKKSLRFRRWGHKSYSAFCSIGRHVTIGHVSKGIADASLEKSGAVDEAFVERIIRQGGLDREEAGDIFSNPLKREDVRTIIENAEKLGRPLALATKTRLAANGADEDLLEYFAFGGAELKIAEDFDAVAAREEIYQIMMGCRRDEYQAAMEHVKEARITAWWDRAVDIIPRNGGKGLAVLKILEHYRLSREEALAFGDGNNDIEMIEAAGWGVAMGNASPELKAAADDICGSAAEDGIYHYCREHGLL